MSEVTLFQLPMLDLLEFLAKKKKNLFFLIDLKEQVLNLQRQKSQNLSGVGSSDKMADCSQNLKESEITVNVVFSMKCMPSL